MVPLLGPKIPPLLCLLFGTALGLVAPKARAWGDDGHRVVGELAWRYLTPATQAAVREALTEPGYESLAEAATWADTYARRHPEYHPMKPFHDVNVDAKAARYQRRAAGRTAPPRLPSVSPPPCLLACSSERYRAASQSVKNARSGASSRGARS